MENDQLSQEAPIEDIEKESWHSPLRKVTPLSKALAAVLFVLLPFLGFWLGLNYGSQHKIVPVQSTVVSEPVADTSVATSSVSDEMNEADETSALDEEVSLADYDLWTYTNEKYGFSISLPEFVKRENVVKTESDYFEAHFDIQVKEEFSQPQVAMSIFVELKKDFIEKYFLEPRSGERSRMVVRPKDYPASYSPYAYLGENDQYIFLYGTGQDCGGLKCTLAELSYDIVKTFSVPEGSGFVSTGSWQSPSDDIEVLKPFYSGEYLIYYPAEWSISKNAEGDFIGFKTVIDCDNEDYLCEPGLYVSVREENNDLPILTWFEQDSFLSGELAESYEQAIVGSNPAVRIVGSYGIGTPIYYYVEYDDKVIEITYIEDMLDETGQQKLDSIISKYFLVPY